MNLPPIFDKNRNEVTKHEILNDGIDRDLIRSLRKNILTPIVQEPLEQKESNKCPENVRKIVEK